MPARGARGRDRAWLRQGDRPADGRDRALQCRPDARDHGDLQRLVRPHAGVVLGATGPVDAAEAPAVDRLDPHRARPGRAGPRLREMGRPAGLARGGARSDPARRLDRQHRRRMGPVYVNLDAELQEAKLAAPLPPIDAARFMPAAVARRRRPQLAAGRRDAARGEAAASSWSGRVSRGDGGLERARRAGRGARRACSPTSRSAPPSRPIIRCMSAPPGICARARSRSTRCARPTSSSASTGSISPARSRRAARAAIPTAQDHPGLARPPAPQRLEHGPSGPAAGRPVHLAAEPDAAVAAAARCGALGAKPRLRARRRAGARRRLAADSITRRASRAARCATAVGDARRLADASAALLERRMLAVPPSARLSRLGRRRRHRRRPGHRGRRGARAARAAAACRSRSAATATS